jgi:hypothetical protein
MVELEPAIRIQRPEHLNVERERRILLLIIPFLLLAAARCRRPLLAPHARLRADARHVEPPDVAHLQLRDRRARDGCRAHECEPHRIVCDRKYEVMRRAACEAHV